MIAAAWLFGAGGAILIGIGGFFLLVRPALLPEDLRYLHRTAGEIDAAVPRLRACCVWCSSSLADTRWPPEHSPSTWQPPTFAMPSRRQWGCWRSLSGSQLLRV